MPKQESFLVREANGVVVEVLKTYDRGYAREVFDGINANAREAFVQALEIDK